VQIAIVPITTLLHLVLLKYQTLLCPLLLIRQADVGQITCPDAFYTNQCV